jgi:hypothetical protein
MNVYSALKSRKWELGNLNDQVDGMIMQAKGRWHSWKMPMTITHTMVQGKRGPRVKAIRNGGRRRLVRCIRHSSHQPDEITVDVIGGKLPVDRMVLAEILRDDNRTWCEREAHWIKAAPKQGRVVLEVFELRP